MRAHLNLIHRILAADGMERAMANRSGKPMDPPDAGTALRAPVLRFGLAALDRGRFVMGLAPIGQGQPGRIPTRVTKGALHA